MTKSSTGIEGTKRLMGSLVRMKPKPHEEMKVGKTKKVKKTAKRMKVAARGFKS
jgi:hypothetical protein